MKNGYLYFHQGWTDIVCQLSLVNYYVKKYDNLKVIMRQDSQNLFNFYIKDLPSVFPIYIPTDHGRHINNDHFNVDFTYDWLFHGFHDEFRNDKFQYSFLNNHNHVYFIEGFYTSYNINYSERIDSFNLIRDENMENILYEKFIKQYGINYIIYHDDINNHIHGPNSISTKIDLPSIPNVVNVNLNNKSDIFFDYLKIIHEAKEIHIIDSVWAAICYQMDSKYGTFNDKIINLYAKRGHVPMFTYPKLLKNWNIII